MIEARTHTDILFRHRAYLHIGDKCQRNRATPDCRCYTSYSTQTNQMVLQLIHTYIQNIDKYGRENSYLYRQ